MPEPTDWCATENCGHMFADHDERGKCTLAGSQRICQCYEYTARPGTDG